MRYEDVEKFMDKMRSVDSTVQISFKTRKPVKGLFIRMQDYNELSRKNLWRVVSETNIPSYKQTKDSNLARIFNGMEFTKLELVT